MFEIGNSLRDARTQRQIELAHAEHDTKIRLKYLAALEREDFSLLPGMVFARGFLRTYASYLGLDAQTYVDEYNARFGRYEEEEHAAGASTTPRTLQRSRHPIPMLRTVFVVMLVALAVLIWIGLRMRPDPTAAAVHGSSAVVPNTQTSGLNEALSGVVHKAEAGSHGAAAAGAAIRGLKITVRKHSTWAQIQRDSSDGPIIYVGTLKAGASRTFHGTRFYVTLGRPSAALLQAGKQTKAPTTASPERFTVTQSSIKLES